MWTRARFNLEAVHRDVNKRKTKEKKRWLCIQNTSLGLVFSLIEPSTDIQHLK
ncbi:Uncharacterized protein APZ42_019683 [Daphnia magna]|uniref:Uncharacterized protein n=1 Tax=Daphnia magna TaxID=35525 RepID=A0A164YBV5_9CRUS|nr:Uncharacterized protein APZ42_019683 [Daphnia magna]